MNKRFAIISDLHIGVHQSSEKWLIEAVKFARWFKDQLYDLNINDIIIPGDFFHDRTDINVLTLQYASQILDIWKDFKIWMIPGNHDCFYKDNTKVSSVSIFSGYSNVTVYNELTTLPVHGKSIMFVPWGATIDKTQKADVIVGHFELNGFKMNSFKVCEGCDEGDELLESSNLIITGHFHLKQERRSKSGKILYVGTPYEMDYNDMGDEKGFHILNMEDTSIEFKLYPHTTKHKKLLLTDIASHKNDLNEYLTKIVSGNVVTLVVDKEVDFDKIGALVQKIQSYGPLSFKGVDVQFNKTNDTVVIDQQVDVHTEQLIGEFIQGMEVENCEEVKRLVLELYNKYKSS